MHSKLSVFLATVLVAVTLTACSHTRNDADIASEVQNKISSDQSISSKQVVATATNGVVTLSGTVGTEFDRGTAGGDAAQVSGVKTVVNNLELARSADGPEPRSARSQPPNPSGFLDVPPANRAVPTPRLMTISAASLPRAANCKAPHSS